MEIPFYIFVIMIIAVTIMMTIWIDCCRQPDNYIVPVWKIVLFGIAVAMLGFTVGYMTGVEICNNYFICQQ